MRRSTASRPRDDCQRCEHGVEAVNPPCTSIEADVFFPPEHGVLSRQSTALAKTLCARCTAREECLAGALARGEQFGIWGGTTPQERARLRAKSGLRARSA